MSEPRFCACGDHAWVPLSKGFVTLVSPRDAALLRHRSWCAFVNQAGNVYALAQRDKCKVYLHRVVLDPPPGVDSDHANGNGLDNRRNNLRIASKSENQRNRKKTRGKSIYKGVSAYRPYGRKPPKCWVAGIAKNGKSVCLGYFATEEEAARAYDAASRRLFGEFASPNFPGAINA